jgi:2,4-dienoyl-CoA reductase (NADPH2)
MAKHEKFNFKSRVEFLAKVSELGADIPFSEDIGILFEKIRIAGKTLPNRLAVHPIEGADAKTDGSPGELTFRRYQRFAAGGSGLIWFEATAVVPEGKSNPGQLWLTKNSQDGFKKLVEKTRSAARGSMGSNHDPMLVLQLSHSGRFAKPAGTPRPVIAQRSPVLDSKLKLASDYPLIGDEELDALQEEFVSAAGLAATAGFDGVDIKACHGYLVSELLAAHSRPGGRYGGSFENRSRFLIETAKKIRESVPEAFVTCRLNAYDGIPYPHGFGVAKNDDKQEDLSEPRALIEELIKIGIPVINISVGVPRHKPYYGRPFDKPVPGASLPDEHPLEGVARLLRITGWLQQAFPSLPFVGTGYSWLRRFLPNVAAAVIKSGHASLIGVGREALAYPDLAAELADHGALNPKKICLTCSGCSRLLSSGGPVGCVVRDKSVYRIPNSFDNAKLLKKSIV